MIGIERRNLILDKLQREKKVLVSELCSTYDVSDETIRRDLDKLEKEGLVVKVYGGAVLKENTGTEKSFASRKIINVSAKQKIAELVAEMVKNGDNIMLDASSTSVEIAKKLKEKDGLMVITNSIEVGVELLGSERCQVTSTGGVMLESSFAMVGAVTERTIRSYYVDKTIFSCKSLDMQAGFTDGDERYASTKIAMLQQCKEGILAVDSTKFDSISYAKIGDFREFRNISTLVTDKKPSGEWLSYLDEMGVKCIYPED